jgi:hypothetical protein
MNGHANGNGRATAALARAARPKRRSKAAAR